MNRFRKTISAIAVAGGLAACYPPQANAQLWLEFAHPDEPHQVGSFLPLLVLDELFADLDASIEVPMVVVLMEFPDDAHGAQYTAQRFGDMFFGNGIPAGAATIQDYYAQTSNGRIQLVPANETHGTNNDGIIGWVMASGDSGSFTLEEKRAEAIVQADDDLNFAQYDQDGNNLIEAHELIVYLINPGPGSGGQTNPTDPETIDVDGIQIKVPVGALPEAALGMKHAHETAHPYFGHGDLYKKCSPTTWQLGDGYICEALSDNCDTPDNDDCGCPDALDPDPVVAIFGTTQDYPDGSGPACGTAGAPNSPTAWFEVYGNGNTFTASTCSFAAFDTQLSVLCDGCDELTCVGGNDDDCGSSSSVTWCTKQDARYVLAVHGAGGQSGVFQIQVTDSGNDCANPIDCELAAAHTRHWYPFMPNFMTVMAIESNAEADNDTVIPMDPWAKIHLGLTKPKVITHDGTYTVYAAEPIRGFDQQDAEPEAYIIYDPQPLSEHGYKRYFIVEARDDPDLDDQGLGIWLIDEDLTTPLACSNNESLCSSDADCGSGTCTRTPNIRHMVRLVHRGGHFPDDDDFLWDGDEIGYYDFGPDSSPRNSGWSDGTPSFVEIYDVSGAGDSMTFKVRIPPVHVDFSNDSGTETGSAGYPFKFLTGGVNLILEPPRSIRIAGGSYPETLTIDTPVTIAHWKGGSAIVGQ